MTLDQEIKVQKLLQLMYNHTLSEKMSHSLIDSAAKLYEEIYLRK